VSAPEPDRGTPPTRHTSRARPLFDPPIIRRALKDAFVKLNPAVEAKNPVMFVVWVGSVVTTLIFFKDIATHLGGWDQAFVGQIALWLWFTVLFANFAEAIAEGRGKAQADELAEDSHHHRRKEDRQRRQGGGMPSSVAS